MSRAVIGVDPGSRRVGVAVSDDGGTIALPHAVLNRSDDDSWLAELVELVRFRKAAEVVVGLPKRLDGSDGREALEARRIAAALHARLGIPVHLLDERFTTKLAEATLRAGQMSARRQRGIVDKVAAAVLLQSFLDSRSQKQPAPGGDDVAGGGRL